MKKCNGTWGDNEECPAKGQCLNFDIYAQNGSDRAARITLFHCHYYLDSSITYPRVLRLHIKDKWWQQIKSGEKEDELRLVNDYWRKRLVDREYDEIHLIRGYPSKKDVEKWTIKRKYNGWIQMDVRHEEFGNEKVKVFVIDLHEEIEQPTLF